MNHAGTSSDDVVQYQRTPRGVAYQRYARAAQLWLASGDPRHVEERRRINADLVRHRDVLPGVVHQNATLANLSIQYANDEYIGERLMPVVTVPKKSDAFYIYDKRGRLAYPDDELGPRGQANEVSEGRSTDSYLCQPYGFEAYVDTETIMNEDAPLDELLDAQESVAEGLAFKREKRIATILTTSANFGSNTGAIAAGNRWDTAGGGNPIKDIQDALSACWTGRGPGAFWSYCSNDVYNTLSRHPAILDLFKYSGSTPGLATPAMIAGFFGLAGLLVGKARQDTANIGAAESYSRIWSNVFGIVRVATRPSMRNASFGYTLRHGPVNSNMWFDQRSGFAGAWWVKNTVSEQSKVAAADTGYLITTPIG